MKIALKVLFFACLTILCLFVLDRNKQIRQLINKGIERAEKVLLDPEEIENIFDILEEQDQNT